MGMMKSRSMFNSGPVTVNQQCLYKGNYSFTVITTFVLAIESVMFIFLKIN